MKKFIIFSDCHWNSADASNDEPQFAEDVVYLGDNHEFKNVDKDDVDELEFEYRQFIQDCTVTNTKAVFGNHEVEASRFLPPDFIYTKESSQRVLFTHGHRFLYSWGKVIKWETRKAGRGKLGRFMSKWLSKSRGIFPKHKLSKSQIRKAVSYANRHACSVIVFGHTHPTKVIDIIVDEVRIINVPRGRTEVSV